MTIVWGGESTPEINQAIGHFVASLIPECAAGFGGHTSLGVLNSSMMLTAGVIFHEWNPSTGVIELSAASIDRRWLSRPVLKAMFSYPFDGIGCQMVVLRVSAKNENAAGRGIKRIAKAYGFTEIVVPRLFGRAHDGVLLTLTDDAWRANKFNEGGSRQ